MFAIFLPNDAGVVTSAQFVVELDCRPLWWWVGLATLCVQGSKWPSTSRLILFQ